ncbi:MAG TPA: molybdate ABC transporter substrate-binding protein [Kofleriaceae bacterium]|nr:molybdate ABC transporter substrate-binding protein [Kofleriaceae bacterium]
MRQLAVGLVVLAAACSSKKEAPANTAPKEVHVAAASDLTQAFTEVGAAFEKKTGIKPNFNFSSSGLLAKQVEQGAPLYLFAAANKSFVDQVVKAGKCDAATAQLYSRGRLVMWAKGGPPAKITDLVDPKYKRIGIANPDHAPYGKAAKQALEKAGIYEQVKDRLVLGENISATMTYAKEGSVDVAFVALSLAISTDAQMYSPVELDLHDPLEQTLVVCGKGPEADAAKQLAEFIISTDGRTIMEHYGFSTTGVMTQK